MTEPEPEHRYYAFISYRHVEPDQTWARWLHSSIETYRVPWRLVKERGLPERIRPLFRDEEELAASHDLSESIKEALRQSRFLIVVCSPNASGSEWVNKEILAFRDTGREADILLLLVSGEPADSFPPALREARRRRVDAPGAAEEAGATEPLAADVRPKPGASPSHLKRMAKLRIIARILGCEFDELRQRDRERKTRYAVAASVVSLLLAAALAGLMYYGMKKSGEAASREKEVRRNNVDMELVKDAGGRHTPFDLDRWRRLDAVRKKAEEADYQRGASEITKRMSCLLPPEARRASARAEESPEMFLVDNSGTRVCALYKDRLEIRDARTYEALHSFPFSRPLNECEAFTALADNVNDRVFYTVSLVSGRCPYPEEGGRRGYFIKSFDGSPPLRVNVSEGFEDMPGAHSPGGVRLRLRLLSKLMSAEGELDERQEVTDRLRLRLGLGESSVVVRADFDPATGLGMYRVYTLDRPPGPEVGMLPSTESVVLYDGGSRLISLAEGVTGKIMKMAPGPSPSKLVMPDYHASLNARHRLALLGDRLFRFTDGGVSEVTTLGLPLNEVDHLELAPDGEGVLVEFKDRGASGGQSSLGLYRIPDKTLHKVSPFDVVALLQLQPAAKQVWAMTKDKRLEAWDITAFHPNGWAAPACPVR